MKHTQRGFAIHEFEDRNGVRCSLQKSSLTTEDAIWLVAQEIGLKRFEPGKGWKDVPLEHEVHLTRKQVKHLLPFLIRFAETGQLEPPKLKAKTKVTLYPAEINGKRVMVSVPED